MEVTGKRLETKEEPDMLCEPCQIENSKSPANGACRECNEYMCSTCFRHHLKSKHSRNHVLLSLDDFSSLTLDSGSEDVTKCEKHDNEIIKFYCRSHDVVGCGDCIVLKHTSCKPEYIKDLVKTFKDGDMHKAIVKRVEDLEGKKNMYGRDNEKSKGELKIMNEKALKEIRLFRTEINKCLDDAEANILSKLQKLTQENKETQLKIETNIQALTFELEKLKQMLNTQIHGENALFINAVNCKSKLSETEKMYENKESDGMLKTFEFVRNENMSGLLKSAEPLGNLKIAGSKEMKQKQFVVGVGVRRGPDWIHGNQDGGGLGTITYVYSNGIANVEWDNGNCYGYHVGYQNLYQLEII